MIVEWIVLASMVAAAVAAVKMKGLLASVAALAVVSLLVSLEMYLLHAPDVALAEAAVGAALSTAIFVLAIKSTRGKKK